MSKSKLNYRFHNPNAVEDTAEAIIKVFIEANQAKVENALRVAEQEQMPKQMQT